MYKTNNSASNTLYGGDRAGSRYYYVVENTAATESAQFTSGAINPAFRNKVTAFQVNPFVKFGGLELFGVIERAEGRASAEAANRAVRQYALDTIYRVGPSDELFIAARYNKVEGQLAGIAGDVGANRWQLGAGMFLTPMLMAKMEYVKQEFTGYPVEPCSPWRQVQRAHVRRSCRVLRRVRFGVRNFGAGLVLQGPPFSYLR